MIFHIGRYISLFYHTKSEHWLSALAEATFVLQYCSVPDETLSVYIKYTVMSILIWWHSSRSAVLWKDMQTAVADCCVVGRCSESVIVYFSYPSLRPFLQCFDAVSWSAGTQEGQNTCSVSLKRFSISNPALAGLK